MERLKDKEERLKDKEERLKDKEERLKDKEERLKVLMSDFQSKIFHPSGIIRQGAAGIQQMRELQNFQAEIQSLHQFTIVNRTLILK